jgi:hypothetical protein
MLLIETVKQAMILRVELITIKAGKEIKWLRLNAIFTKSL